jgi:hypothetical protein
MMRSPRAWSSACAWHGRQRYLPSFSLRSGRRSVKWKRLAPAPPVQSAAAWIGSQGTSRNKGGYPRTLQYRGIRRFAVSGLLGIHPWSFRLKLAPHARLDRGGADKRRSASSARRLPPARPTLRIYSNCSDRVSADHQPTATAELFCVRLASAAATAGPTRSRAISAPILASATDWRLDEILTRRGAIFTSS